MAHDVFISYSTKDKLTADAVCATLEAEAIRCWIAPRDVWPGATWDEAIIDAIDGSRAMVLVFSSNANESKQIKREVVHAIDKGVTVVPLRIEDVVPARSLAYYINSLHWMDALTPPMEEHLGQLAGKLISLLALGDGEASTQRPAPDSRQTSPSRKDLIARLMTRRGMKTAAIAVIAILMLAVFISKPRWLAWTPDDSAARTMASEVLGNLASIDARLSYVQTALTPDRFDAELEAARSSVAPREQQPSYSQTQQRIAKGRIGPLREALNSSPLRTDYSQSLVQSLAQNGVDPETVRWFYTQLTEVNWATGLLLTSMSSAASTSGDSGDWNTYGDFRMALAVETLANRSTIAHVSGLRLLSDLTDFLPADVAERLAALNHLQPTEMITDDQADILLSEAVLRAKDLQLKRQATVVGGKMLVDQDVGTLAQAYEQLEIQPDDPWSAVVDKARTLRQLGRITASIAAFSRYADMFADTDPTAEQFARTAQAFTLQMQRLGLKGGVYLYEVAQASAAMQGGLAVGDILTRFAGKNIQNMNDMVSALRDAPAGESLRVDYLRLDETGHFHKRTATVTGGPLGANYMPI